MKSLKFADALEIWPHRKKFLCFPLFPERSICKNPDNICNGSNPTSVLSNPRSFSSLAVFEANLVFRLHIVPIPESWLNKGTKAIFVGVTNDNGRKSYRLHPLKCYINHIEKFHLQFGEVPCHRAYLDLSAKISPESQFRFASSSTVKWKPKFS